MLATRICLQAALRTHSLNLRAFGPGGGPILSVFRVSARALLGVFREVPLEGQREAPLAALIRAALKLLMEALIGAYLSKRRIGVRGWGLASGDRRSTIPLPLKKKCGDGGVNREKPGHSGSGSMSKNI